jgi:myo-inositol-1-phosphate synthase
VRCCKLALNHGLGGQLDGPSSYLMKSPHNQRPDEQARADTEKFIATYGGRPGARAGRRKAKASAASSAGKPTAARSGTKASTKRAAARR